MRFQGRLGHLTCVNTDTFPCPPSSTHHRKQVQGPQSPTTYVSRFRNTLSTPQTCLRPTMAPQLFHTHSTFVYLSLSPLCTLPELSTSRHALCLSSAHGPCQRCKPRGRSVPLPNTPSLGLPSGESTPALRRSVYPVTMWHSALSCNPHLEWPEC